MRPGSYYTSVFRADLPSTTPTPDSETCGIGEDMVVVGKNMYRDPIRPANPLQGEFGTIPSSHALCWHTRCPNSLLAYSTKKQKKTFKPQQYEISIFIQCTAQAGGRRTNGPILCVGVRWVGKGGRIVLPDPQIHPCHSLGGLHRPDHTVDRCP